MDIKILIITIVFLALAFAGLLIKILIRPGSELPRGTCGYGMNTNDGKDGCAACDYKNTEKCKSDIVLK